MFQRVPRAGASRPVSCALGSDPYGPPVPARGSDYRAASTRRPIAGAALAIALSLVTVFSGSALAQGGDECEIRWSTVDSGGGMSTGNGYTMRGTVGQHDADLATPLTGDGYVLFGGYWLPNPTRPEIPEPAHDVRKHRYLTINTITNPRNVALKVELVSMKRCSGEPSRACMSEDDCEAAVPGSGTCIEHPDVGTAGAWWVQAPQQEQLGCLPGPCGDEDWLARVDATPYFDTWTLSTLHIGDCEVIPVATYEIRACLPPDGLICSDPLIIGTIGQPFVSPGFRGNYGDVAGTVVGTEFAPPDGFTNVVDISAYILTKQNYGTANNPQTHPTWVDLHGVGSSPFVCREAQTACNDSGDCPPGDSCTAGNPPQYIINVADLTQIKKAFAGDPWTSDPGNMTPAQCP
ncbi:MAG: hypothetical protein ACE5HE_15025 [Phycisphaerae bacterium]